MPDTAIVAFRFGFGLPLPKGAAVEPNAMVEALTRPDSMRNRFPSVTSAELFPVMDEIQDWLKIRRRGSPEDSKAAAAKIRELTAQIAAKTELGLRTAMARALDAPDDLRERLVLFWADHFTTTARNRYAAALPVTHLDEAIRPNLAGKFEDLLIAATLHPAMLDYLDQTSSVGPNSPFGQRKNKGLNENLARELIELHTMGAGTGYTQSDVRELAELLTGVFVAKDGFRFAAARAEPGPETVLGTTYKGSKLEPILAVLRDLARRPETARHLATKLAVHFVSDTPDPALVSSIETAWQESSGDLPTAYRALLNHPSAWQAPATKARQPFEYLVAALRAMGLTGSDMMALPTRDLRRAIMVPLRQMGQPWLSAPGPDGWPEAPERWLNAPGLAARITWAMEQPLRLLSSPPDPETLMQRALGPRISTALAWAVPKAETQRSGLGLVLASPEFNRR
ncbi:DUF1800 domain-containing protein [Thioclava sp. FR2]|uniref:DUF1800 domain-containing protein n=1 Tax=Thioclava sp. FR2 TaxID=3445780 RepID=UPI003EB9B48C